MGRTITKEQLAEYPLEEFQGDIVIIENLATLEQAICYLSNYKILGFDTETRPAFQKGNIHSVSLIQLATETVCFLFRLNKIGFPPCLIDLLLNSAILKIGLSIRDDFQAMGRRMKFTPQGFIDLQQMVIQYDIEDLSLQKVYGLLFHKKISKSQRLSNWDAVSLSEAQQKYAALDAWACLKIYQELCPTKNCF